MPWADATMMSRLLYSLTMTGREGRCIVYLCALNVFGSVQFDGRYVVSSVVYTCVRYCEGAQIYHGNRKRRLKPDDLC